MEHEILLNSLVKMFLQYRNPDEGYFKAFRAVKRLEYKGIFIEMNDIQNRAYECREVE